MSIIQKLYEANRDAPTPREKRVLKTMLEYEDRIQEAFGLDFLNAMLDAQDSFDAANTEASYRRGFTDCFQLWLEVFSKYSS